MITAILSYGADVAVIICAIFVVWIKFNDLPHIYDLLFDLKGEVSYNKGKLDARDS